MTERQLQLIVAEFFRHFNERMILHDSLTWEWRGIRFISGYSNVGVRYPGMEVNAWIPVPPYMGRFFCNRAEEDFKDWLPF